VLIAEQLFVLLDVMNANESKSVAVHPGWTEVTITDGESYQSSCVRFILGANNVAQQMI